MNKVSRIFLAVLLCGIAMDTAAKKVKNLTAVPAGVRPALYHLIVGGNTSASPVERVILSAADQKKMQRMSMLPRNPRLRMNAFVVVQSAFFQDAHDSVVESDILSAALIQLNKKDFHRCIAETDTDDAKRVCVRKAEQDHADFLKI